MEESKTDPRDAKIQELEAALKELTKAGLQLTAELADARRKLKAAKSAPLGDTVTLGRDVYAVKRTVMAKDALDEVKKGHIEGDCTLVVIDRRE